MCTVPRPHGPRGTRAGLGSEGGAPTWPRAWAESACGRPPRSCPPLPRRGARLRLSFGDSREIEPEQHGTARTLDSLSSQRGRTEVQIPPVSGTPGRAAPRAHLRVCPSLSARAQAQVCSLRCRHRAHVLTATHAHSAARESAPVHTHVNTRRDAGTRVWGTCVHTRSETQAHAHYPRHVCTDTACVEGIPLVECSRVPASL